MTLRRMGRGFGTGLSSLAVTMHAVILLLALTGCSRTRAPVPSAPVAGTEVIGTLVALKDDRPADGGFDLTLETAQGVRELVRVPSIFMAPPPESVQAMHEVVDAAK